MRILVVDDIRTYRVLAARILERAGHNIKTAGSGTEAIDTICKEDFDIVLMDGTSRCRA